MVPSVADVSNHHMSYGAARAASQAVVAFCAKTGPVAGLHDIDVAHNIGASANPLTGALKTLQANLDDNITAIFTRAKNTPTPNVC